MDGELKQYLIDMETRMVANLKTYIDQRIEDSESKLLVAFHGWSRSMEIRVRGVSTVAQSASLTAQGFDERLGLIEDRVSELERRRTS